MGILGDMMGLELREHYTNAPKHMQKAALAIAEAGIAVSDDTATYAGWIRRAMEKKFPDTKWTCLAVEGVDEYVCSGLCNVENSVCMRIICENSSYGGTGSESGVFSALIMLIRVDS